MLMLFQRIWRVALLVPLLASTVHAQNDAASRRAAIEGMYPVMMAALEAGNFGRARNICDQAIIWEPQNPVHHYNLACIEAQAGGPRLPYSWGALELAIALGFDDAEHLQSDPDLAPLRGDPRFANLMRKVQNNASGGDAIASIAIPAAKSSTPAMPAAESEPPAEATFKDDLPVGLYLMSRYWPSTQTLEKSVWYFAPDRVVYRDLEEGFSRADLAVHAGPCGIASRSGRSIEIAWSDGKKSGAEFERDGTGFTWDMGIFTPIAAFESPHDIVGVYEGAKSVAAGSSAVPVAQRLELRADGTFSWSGVSFSRADGNVVHIVMANNELTTGQWELSGYSLTIREPEGAVLRRIAFPQDDEHTVVKPDRMFFGGLVYKRRP